MTVIRMSVATVTASPAAEISLCVVIVYNHRLGVITALLNRLQVRVTVSDSGLCCACVTTFE